MFIPAWFLIVIGVIVVWLVIQYIRSIFDLWNHF